MNRFLIMGMSMLNEYQNNQNDFKDRTLKRWGESINMPRKKKKQVRKSLMLDWQIANYDPFNGLF